MKLSGKDLNLYTHHDGAVLGGERWKTGSGSTACQAGWREVAALGDRGTRGVQHDDEKNNNIVNMCYILLTSRGMC